VTFVDNHDTGGSQNHWPFPGYHVGLGYGYIFTHPGIPCIFWPHLYGKEGGLIKDLIELRKRNGIRADSKIEIKCAQDDMYIAVINDCVMFKCGPGTEMGDFLPKESDGWKIACTGKDFAVWERSSTEAAVQSE